MAELPTRRCARALRLLLLLVVFGIKAAIFPLFFWLPDSYPTAPTPVTAVFAGLLTKVGVYAIIRTQTLLVPDDTVRAPAARGRRAHHGRRRVRAPSPRTTSSASCRSTSSARSAT
jgi:formate hydrogenlyase subunit 3/multisubunit Na+/H+ antiporter MnhD subunit